MPDRNTFRTKTGRVLNHADLEALADQAEAGYDVGHLASQPLRARTASAPLVVVAVRLPADLAAAVQALAASENTSLNELVRDALRRWVAKPALPGN